MVANKYAFLQITRRRFLNEWEAFKKVISRRNIRRRITIPLTLSNLKLIRVNRAKKSGMVNITSSVNSRERSGINTILHELNPLFTINVTMRDIKSKNVYSRVNSK